VFSGTSNSGYFIISPFKTLDGRTILVNRGWVHAGDMQRDRSFGKAKIEGLVRFGENINNFTPENDITKNQWYYIDLDAMSTIANSERFIIELVRHGNLA
jgi:surfeit locus 1 family protein